MPHVTEHILSDGSTAYKAHVNIKRNGKWVHRESKSFQRRSAAEAWGKERLRQINAMGGDLSLIRHGKAHVSDAIDRYVTESRKQIGRTKAQVLNSIKEYDIADMRCADVGSADIVQFAKELAAVRSPATVGNYLSHLASVFAVARPAWKIPLDASAMTEARVVCTRLGLTGKAQKRDRRPTKGEMSRLMEFFEDTYKSHPGSIPMHKVCGFAMFSTRRQEEIARIFWDHLDKGHMRVLVKDMKHPGQKIGNDVWCDVPEPAMAIALGMPEGDKRVFPFNHRTISARFTRACQFLQIHDLRFHDLRHEGVSRLFEMGKTIPQVAGVSGHRSWSSLQRYTHLRETGDKWNDWEWKDRLASRL